MITLAGRVARRLEPLGWALVPCAGSRPKPCCPSSGFSLPHTSPTRPQAMPFDPNAPAFVPRYVRSLARSPAGSVARPPPPGERALTLPGSLRARASGLTSLSGDSFLQVLHRSISALAYAFTSALLVRAVESAGCSQAQSEEEAGRLVQYRRPIAFAPAQGRSVDHACRAALVRRERLSFARPPRRSQDGQSDRFGSSGRTIRPCRRRCSGPPGEGRFVGVRSSKGAGCRSSVKEEASSGR
jgi:hypothetical protein